MQKLCVLVMLLITCGTVQAGFMDEVDKLVTGGQEIREQAAPAQEEPSTEPRQEAPTAGEDRHYIQPDDFFISEQPMGDNAWIYVTLAKMSTPPSKQTKGEAEFFKIKDGNNLWTRYYWRSRVAKSDEIRLGTTLIMFEGNSLHDAYQAPGDKAAARSNNWFMAKVTDVSDLYKGYVTVSGGYKVNPKNLRVLVGK